ncbi:MAG: hypothetical protein LBF58_06595 [Deltaproteobacteria bacterium]|nr:hypothetical protein [Deltaproteobacteria bacterium]
MNGAMNGAGPKRVRGRGGDGKPKIAAYVIKGVFLNYLTLINFHTLRNLVYKNFFKFLKLLLIGLRTRLNN